MTLSLEMDGTQLLILLKPGKLNDYKMSGTNNNNIICIIKQDLASMKELTINFAHFHDPVPSDAEFNQKLQA